MTIMDDNGSIVGDTEVDECMLDEGDHPKCRRCGQPIVGHIYYGSHGAECETCWRLSEEIRAKSRGGKATSIYATTETLGNISGYLHQKEMDKRRKEIEGVLNRRTY